MLLSVARKGSFVPTTPASAHGSFRCRGPTCPWSWVANFCQCKTPSTNVFTFQKFVGKVPETFPPCTASLREPLRSHHCLTMSCCSKTHGDHQWSYILHRTASNYTLEDLLSTIIIVTPQYSFVAWYLPTVNAPRSVLCQNTILHTTEFEKSRPSVLP